MGLRLRQTAAGFHPAQAQQLGALPCINIGTLEQQPRAMSASEGACQILRSMQLTALEKLLQGHMLASKRKS